MAEGVLFNIAEGIIGRLGSVAFQEIGLIWGVQDEFRKLKETVVAFQAVLLDAEQKQANNEVKLWLQSVEDAVYEADDVLDEFNIKAQQRQMVPENTKVSKKRLIRLWVAQGFIKSSDENKGLEDVAYEYYRELLWRSFFQEEEKDEFGIIRSCKMHDLMNELAILVSGIGSVVVESDQKNFHEKLRHVSFNFQVDMSEWEVPTSLPKAKKIRTFLFLCQNELSDIDGSLCDSFCAIIVSNFKSLRMLSLSKLGIKGVPKCLRKMKYLRYLDVSGNRMERLPDWIVGLSNLETLDLSWYQSLMELPRDIKKMFNLRHLIFEGCSRLTGMPRGIGELKGVRTLNRFVLSESNCLGRGGSAGLVKLGTLNELRGDLQIWNLRHEKDVVSESNVGRPLKDKHHLHSLELIWKEGEDVKAVDEEDIIMSMEELQPHSNLKQLSVLYYGGVRFTSWFSSLINIVHLTLWDCERCQHLPPLDHLPSLKSLELRWLEKLEYILLSEKESSNSMSDEMMRISLFPSLEQLSIVHCPVLKGWWRAHTHNSASSSSTENMSFPSFPCLSTLYINWCPNLSSLPEGTRALPCLSILHILCCPILSERCRKETGEDWPKIAHIPHIDIRKDDTMWIKDFVIHTFAFSPTNFNYSFLVFLIFFFSIIWGVNLLDSICDAHVDCLEWLYMILLLIIGV